MTVMDFSTQYFYFHGKSWMATFSYLPISIIYRTSREPPTQNKDIFQLLNALLSVELNVRHYASNSFCFSSSNGEWSKLGPYPSFLKAVWLSERPVSIFFSHCTWISIRDSWIYIHCPCHGPCHGEA